MREMQAALRAQERELAFLRTELARRDEAAQAAEDPRAADEAYAAWRGTVGRRLDAVAGEGPADGPLISVILPVHATPPGLLEAALASLRAQTYRRWEVCVAVAESQNPRARRLLARLGRRDRRVRVIPLSTNYGIAGNSNAALDAARGSYVALLDHDDVLPPSALARVAAAIRARPEADFLYTDKDLVDGPEGRRSSPLFKPGWSPEMLYSVNYLTHLNVIRTELLRRIGGWSIGVDGAQDWDLFLRVMETEPHVVHLPGVGYGWRVHAASTSAGMAVKPYAAEAQLRALARHAERTGLRGRFEPYLAGSYRIAWDATPPCRVVVLAARDLAPLPGLITRLVAEGADLAQVDLLVSPQQAWGFQAAWRAGRGAAGRPRLCEIVDGDPVRTCAALLAEAPEAVTVFVDGGVALHTTGALRQLAGWLAGDGPVAFASGVAVEGGDRVVEAGCVRDEAGVVHPLFRSERLMHLGPAGGPLWIRNVEAASPYLLAMRTRDVAPALAAATGQDWRGAFHDVCARLVAARPGGRGVVDPSARAALAEGAAFPAPSEGLIGRGDRYLNPHLTLDAAGVVRLRGDLVHAA